MKHRLAGHVLIESVIGLLVVAILAQAVFDLTRTVVAAAARIEVSRDE